MRVLEAARLVRAGVFPLPRLWLIATKPERVQLALLLGRPDELPPDARTPDAAWRALNLAERRLVLRHAPPTILARLPPEAESGRRMVWRGRMVAAEAAALAA